MFEKVEPKQTKQNKNKLLIQKMDLIGIPVRELKSLSANMRRVTFSSPQYITQELAIPLCRRRKTNFVSHFDAVVVLHLIPVPVVDIHPH
jgi:NADPH-dependent ferric siderophore reductase